MSALGTATIIAGEVVRSLHFDYHGSNGVTRTTQLAHDDTTH